MEPNHVEETRALEPQTRDPVPRADMEPSSVEKTRTFEPRTRDPVPRAEMAHILEGVLALREGFSKTTSTRIVEPGGLDAFRARTGFRPAGGPPVIVVGQDVALELGHPRTESQAAALWSAVPGLVTPGRVTLLGPELGDLPPGARWPFGLLGCLELDPAIPVDPFAMELLLHLPNRLPGFMVRALPGRLWARIGAGPLARGLSLADVGEALVRTYSEELPGVRAVEVLLVTDSAEAVRHLAPFVTEARVLAGRHKKLVLSPQGDLECEELDCERCDERETCLSLRDILARRRAARETARIIAAGGEHG